MGACHIALGAVCLSVYPGVGAFHSTRQNSYLGAYPGYYGTYTLLAGGIIQHHCTGTYYDHAVQIVGYDMTGNNIIITWSIFDVGVLIYCYHSAIMFIST